MLEPEINSNKKPDIYSVVEEATQIVLEGFSRERTSLARRLRADRLQLMGELRQLGDSHVSLAEDRRIALERQLSGLDGRLIRTLIFDF